MRNFNTEELITFLRSVDRHLKHTQKIEILGGGALALVYDMTHRTKDIDLFNRMSRELVQACEAAQNETGLLVEMSHSTVSQAPYEAEERMIRILPELEHLTVFVLDRYDVTLSKVVRGLRKDLDALRSMHQQQPLDEEVLVDRYVREMDHVIGYKRGIDQNFINLIGHLYGSREAKWVRGRLPGWESGSNTGPKRKAKRHRAPKKD